MIIKMMMIVTVVVVVVEMLTKATILMNHEL